MEKRKERRKKIAGSDSNVPTRPRDIWKELFRDRRGTPEPGKESTRSESLEIRFAIATATNFNDVILREGYSYREHLLSSPTILPCCVPCITCGRTLQASAEERYHSIGFLRWRRCLMHGTAACSTMNFLSTL